jgi:hypothetical protein
MIAFATFDFEFLQLGNGERIDQNGAGTRTKAALENMEGAQMWKVYLYGSDQLSAVVGFNVANDKVTHPIEAGGK